MAIIDSCFHGNELLHGYACWTIRNLLRAISNGSSEKRAEAGFEFLYNRTLVHMRSVREADGKQGAGVDASFIRFERSSIAYTGD